MKNLNFILFNKELNKIFITKANGQISLPVYDTQVTTNVGFDNPDIYNQWFERKYGFRVFRRYAIDSLYIDEAFFILECYKKDQTNILTSGIWIDIDDFQHPSRDIVLSVLKNYNSSYSMPWVTEDGFTEYIKWVEEKLFNLGINEISDIRQIKNAYVSTVFRFVTDKGDFYLKIIGSGFIREREITEDIIRWRFLPTVDVIAFKGDNSAYLMKDMGGCNLEDNLDEHYLKEVIVKIAQFQKRIINEVKLEDLKDYYNITIPTMLKEVDNLPYKCEVLLKGSKYQLSDSERSNLVKSLKYYRQILEEIDATIPNSLDHGDLRPGNIRINSEKSIIIYDWSWSSYTHPFFTIINFLHVVRENEIVKSIREELLDIYINEWREYASKEKLRKAYMNIEKLTRLYHAIADALWLESAVESYSENKYDKYSADGWLIDRRQYYFAHVLRRLIK